MKGDLIVTNWRAQRSFQAGEFPLERLLAVKRESVAVVLPAREVAATIGAIAECVAELQAAGLIDEALVIDSASADGTVQIATAAGMRVVQENDIASECGPTQGKGDAMWRSLRIVQSDIVAEAKRTYPDWTIEQLAEHRFPLGFNPRPQRLLHRLGSQRVGDLDIDVLLGRAVLNLPAIDVPGQAPDSALHRRETRWARLDSNQGPTIMSRLAKTPPKLHGHWRFARSGLVPGPSRWPGFVRGSQGFRRTKAPIRPIARERREGQSA